MKICLTDDEAAALGVLIDVAVCALRARALTNPANFTLIEKLSAAAQAEITKQQRAAKKAGGKPDGHSS